MPGDPPISDPEHERAAEEAAAGVEVEPQVDVIPRPPAPPEHVGDGVYVSFDGWHVNVAVNDHRNHAVAFDPYALRGLIEYARRVGAL